MWTKHEGVDYVEIYDTAVDHIAFVARCATPEAFRAAADQATAIVKAMNA